MLPDDKCNDHGSLPITKQPVSFWVGGLGVAINDRFIDLNEMREHLADYYSQTGRSSIAPELMIRMLVIG